MLTQTGELRLSRKHHDVPRIIVKWFQLEARPLPWREDFVKHSDPYHVWVSEIMLQQTTIAAVLPKYKSFIKRFPTVEKFASSSQDQLQRMVAGLGYYRRFRLMHEAAQNILENCEFPNSYRKLLELKGVGDYTASAISSICFNEPEAVVDGNVERVICRLFDLRLPPNHPQLKKVFKKTLNTIICRDFPGDFNQGIMELGQLTCTQSNPNCRVCPLNQLCAAKKNKSTDLAPGQKLKPKSVELTTSVYIVKKGRKILLHKRPESSKFFRNMEGFQIDISSKPKAKPDGFFKHTITNHKLSNNVYLLTSSNTKVSTEGRWVSIEDLDAQILTSFDKKAWGSIEKRL